MRGIRLVFYNKSDDNFSSDVVIFPWGGDASNTVAWTVIENCERGWIHPFVYDPWLEINASDSWGTDIVMTGGGFGPGAKPYVFTLENVVHV